jgi:hypothetical protein
VNLCEAADTVILCPQHQLGSVSDCNFARSWRHFRYRDKSGGVRGVSGGLRDPEADA